jgi:3-hydroxybutyryl-CoA dehydratase
LSKPIVIEPVNCELFDQGAVMSEIRLRTIQGLKVGDKFTVSRQFTEKDVRRFAEVTRDYNPVHFEPRFSEAKNFKDPICHGLLVGSMLTEIGGQIGWLASVMNFRFKLPVYFEETISCRFTITAIDDRGRARAEAVYLNQEGHIVLEAELEGILPDDAQRRMLDRMAAERGQTPKLE